MKNLSILHLVNGSQVVEILINPTWIPEENAYFGKTQTGESYYAWDVNSLGYAFSYRRITE